MRKCRKVLDFIATTENISVINILLQNTAATGRKMNSIPTETRTPMQKGLGTEKTDDICLFVQHKRISPRIHWKEDAVKMANASFKVQEQVPL